MLQRITKIRIVLTFLSTCVVATILFAHRSAWVAVLLNLCGCSMVETMCEYVCLPTLVSLVALLGDVIVML